MTKKLTFFDIQVTMAKNAKGSGRMNKFNERTLIKYLEQYTDFEKIYKRRYGLLGDSSAVMRYMDTIDDGYITNNLLLLPEKLTARFRNENGVIWQNEPLSLANSAPSLLIEKHPRYMAEFWHNHSFFELLYMYSGQCHNSFHASGAAFTLHKGECCIVAPRVTHRVGIFDDSILINVQIRPELMTGFFRLLWENDSRLAHFLIAALHEDAYYPYILFHCLPVKKTWAYLSAAYAEQLNNAPYAYNFVLPNIYLFLAALLGINDKSIFLPARDKNNLKKIGAIMSYIEQNFQTIALEELAEKLHYSSAYLSRIIKKNTGKTFTEIIQTLRLEYAANLLKTSGKSVAAIAEACGYGSDEHFIRIFRKNYRQTPLQYKKANAT